MGELTAINLIRIIFSLLGCFVMTALGIVCWRILSNFRSALARKNFQMDEEAILKYLQNGDSSHLKGIKIHSELRDLLVRMGSNISGDIQTKLMLIYGHLGFVIEDFKAMAGGDGSARVFALERCRSLCVPLPEEAWPLLLRSRSLVCRWATMEYMVAMKGRAAMPWVIRFIYDDSNRKKGVILHLLACLAKVSPEVIPVLLDHCDDDFYREQFLRTLASYPSPGCESIIANSIRSTSATELLLAGIKALAAHPSTDSLPLLLSLAAHENWVVRMVVAEALMAFIELQATEALEILTIDTSFPVRSKAVSSLIGLRKQETLSLIADDAQHPSHEIYKRLIAAAS